MQTEIYLPIFFICYFRSHVTRISRVSPRKYDNYERTKVNYAKKTYNLRCVIFPQRNFRPQVINIGFSLFLLQEQILRLRMTADNDRDAISAPYHNPYSPPQLTAQQQIPMKYIAIAIAMAIFGLVLGKFVL